MVGLRMIQISGMGEQRFKSGKKCRFSPFLASVARTHSLAQQTSSLQGLGHFGQYLGSPQGLGPELLEDRDLLPLRSRSHA